MAGRRSGGGSFAAKLTPHTTPMQTLKKLGTSALTDEGIRGESWLACLVYLRLPASAAAILRRLGVIRRAQGEAHGLPGSPAIVKFISVRVLRRRRVVVRDSDSTTIYTMIARRTSR